MADLNVKVGLDRSGFQTGLAAMENSVQGFGRNLTGILTGAFSFGAIASTITSVIAKASRLQDLSDSFGVSAEAIQRIGNAAAETGASIDDVGQALGKIGVAAQQAFSGNDQLAASFAAIGVRGQELINLSPEQLFYRLAAAMNNGSLAGKDLAVAKDLLGRGFAALLPVLKMSEDEIRAVGEAAGVMSDDAVEKLDSFGDSWGRLANTVKIKTAEILDASIRLGEELFSNPMSFLGDWQEIEKNIEKRQQKDKSAREALRKARDMSGVSQDDSSSDKDAVRQKEKLLRAQQKYDEAAAQNAAASMDANEKIGQKNAEIVEMQTRLNGLQKDSAEYYNLAAEILRKQTELTQLKNEALQDSVRLQQEEARAAEHLADTKRRMEDIEAKRAGGSATEDLLKKRAKDAIDKYKETGKSDDRLAAVQAREDYENAVQSRFYKEKTYKYYYSSPEAMAREAGDALGKIAPLSEAMNDKASINSQADMPKEQTILKISDDVRKAVDKLDSILRSSGSFGY